ncbi:hypothetical protein [Streptomyces nigrescens]
MSTELFLRCAVSWSERARDRQPDMVVLADAEQRWHCDELRGGWAA